MRQQVVGTILKFSKQLGLAVLITGVVLVHGGGLTAADPGDINWQPDPAQLQIYNNNIADFDVAECGAEDSASSTNVPAGTLPKIVPEPYNGAFTQGANNHNVSPALVAALFTEENFTGIDPAKIADRWTSFTKTRTDPNSIWLTSGVPSSEVWPDGKVGAGGPFQFEPTTLKGLGYDLSKRDDLVTSADAAAKYAQTEGATKDKTNPATDYKKFIYSYNHLDSYVAQVLVYYNFYNSGGTDTGPIANTSDTTGQNTGSGCSSSSSAGATSAECTGTSGTVTGNLALLCEAEKFDPFGYKSGGGHEDPEKFMQDFNSAGGFTQPFKQYLDCSGLVIVAVWNAYHVKLTLTSDQFGKYPQYFKRIDPKDAQPGDILQHPGHDEIATNAGGSKHFGAHTANAPAQDQISEVGGESWTNAYVWIGPGSNRQ